jgi:hypothetical protein
VPKLLGFSVVHASMYGSARDFVGTVADPAFQLGALFPVNELTMNLAAKRVDHSYL